MKQFKAFFSGVSLLLLFSLVLTAGVMGIADYSIPDSLSVFRGEDPAVSGIVTFSMGEELPISAHATRTSATARLFGILPLKEVEVTTFDTLSLCPGGEVFGIRMLLGGALITSVTKPFWP